MKTRLPHIVGLLALWTTCASASDLGGMSINFTPDQARPGDLVTLSIQMNREDYGEFALEIPSHPQLHLVTREQIPPIHVKGNYYQGERLMLQAISSGTITLEGVSVELTESSGTRTVELPPVTLTVSPFDSEDANAAPEQLPEPNTESAKATALAPSLIAMIIGGFILILLIRLKLAANESAEMQEAPGRTFATVLRAATISNEDLEALFTEKGDAFSPELRNDLETFLYTADAPEETRSELHERLRKELGS
jgi:hypothetical protein